MTVLYAIAPRRGNPQRPTFNGRDTKALGMHVWIGNGRRQGGSKGLPLYDRVQNIGHPGREITVRIKARDIPQQIAHELVLFVGR
jgi:hypothetical protein